MCSKELEYMPLASTIIRNVCQSHWPKLCGFIRGLFRTVCNSGEKNCWAVNFPLPGNTSRLRPWIRCAARQCLASHTVHCKKKLAIFLSPAYSRPERVWLVTYRLGTGKSLPFLYSALWFVTCDTGVKNLIKFKKTASRLETATGNCLE
jgi:hypothetical protein